MITEHKRYN